MNVLLLLVAVLLQAGPVYLPLLLIAGEPVTPTPTATPTTTWTPTATASSTATPAHTATWTATPTATATATVPPTSTATSTATWTATTTPTASPTWTATATATPAPGLLRIGVLQCETTNEYVRIDNIGGAIVSMAGWRILSVVGPQTYFFPGYQLQPGASVYVHSGPDAPPSSGNRLRWTTAYIWNNNGDEARLMSPSGAVVSNRSC